MWNWCYNTCLNYCLVFYYNYCIFGQNHFSQAKPKCLVYFIYEKLFWKLIFLFEIKIGSKLFVLRKLYQIVVFEILTNLIAKCIQKLNLRMKILPNFLWNFYVFLVVLDFFFFFYDFISIFYNFSKTNAIQLTAQIRSTKSVRHSLDRFVKSSLK